MHPASGWNAPGVSSKRCSLFKCSSGRSVFNPHDLNGRRKLSTANTGGHNGDGLPQKDQASLAARVLTLWHSSCETQRRMIAMRCDPWDPSNGHNSALPSTTEPAPATEGQERGEDGGQGIECRRDGACWDGQIHPDTAHGADMISSSHPYISLLGM